VNKINIKSDTFFKTHLYHILAFNEVLIYSIKMKSNQSYNLLATCPIFTNVPANEIKSRLSLVRHHFITLPKNKILALRGELYDELMILLKGSIKAEMMDSEGRTLEIEVITPPNPVAPAFILGKNNRTPVDLVSLTEINLLILPQKALLNLLHSDKTIMTNFLNILSNKAHFLSERLFIMSFKNIKQKFSFYLLELQKKSGSDTVKLSRSITDLSQYFGVSRPSLSRVIGDMEAKGIIRAHKKQITLLNTNLLKSLIEE
jgi:CRP-like cAMP-binding protein